MPLSRLADPHQQVMLGRGVLEDLGAVLVEEGLEFAAQLAAAGGADYGGVLVLHGGGLWSPEVMDQHELDPGAGGGKGTVDGVLRFAGQENQGLAVFEEAAVLADRGAGGADRHTDHHHIDLRDHRLGSQGGGPAAGQGLVAFAVQAIHEPLAHGPGADEAESIDVPGPHLDPGITAEHLDRPRFLNDVFLQAFDDLDDGGGVDMALGLDIDPEPLGLDIVFGAQVEEVDAAPGEFAQDIVEQSHPVPQGVSEEGGGVVAGGDGHGRTDDRKAGPVVGGHLSLPKHQAIVVDDGLGIDDAVGGQPQAFDLVDLEVDILDRHDAGVWKLATDELFALFDDGGATGQDGQFGRAIEGPQRQLDGQDDVVDPETLAQILQDPDILDLALAGIIDGDDGKTCPAIFKGAQDLADSV